MADSIILLEKDLLNITINRLGFQIIENHYPFSDTVLLGLQPRGILLADKISQFIQSQFIDVKIQLGYLDATFHRDDIHLQRSPILPQSQKIDFSLEQKRVILIDDVLFTGRTIRAGLEAMLDFGRPNSVELCVLIDRRYSRQLPIEPNYVGLTVDSRAGQKVKVDWENQSVTLKTQQNPLTDNLITTI